MTPVLSARNVVLRRGPEGRSFDLRIHALDLLPGHAVSLHGPSGSGKSTCLEILAGIVRVDTARRLHLNTLCGDTVDMADTAVDTARLRAGPIGFGPQSGGLLGFLDARANAAAAIELSGRVGDRAIRDRFDRLVLALDLADCLCKDRSALSGGQRKRVSLLRAMAVPRRLLILDEPTAGLDDALADLTVACILETCEREGTACVAAMHDRDRATSFGMSPLQLHADSDGATLGARSMAYSE